MKWEEQLAMSQFMIAEAQDRISKQARLVEELSQRGEDTPAARQLLDTLKANLVMMEENHQLLLSDLRRGWLDSGTS